MLNDRLASAASSTGASSTASSTVSSIASATGSATAAREDSLGCLSSRLQHDRELDTGEFRFYRKCTLGSDTNPVVMDGSGRGFLIGVSLRTGHRRRIHSQHRWTTHEFERDSVYVRDLADDYRAELLGGFDFVLIELSRAFVSDTCHERGRGLARIATVAGHKDPVLGHLAQVLALTLDAENNASPLFVEQLGVTIGTHLLDRYGEPARGTGQASRRLSPLQEARAKEMLLARSQGNVSIEEIAGACNLSRSYFIRAFRETTQRTPHQWLLERRVDQARELLKRSDRSLSDIAMACGFSDQSHFTRTFSQLVGTPPGHWRRQAGR
ncbi:helix-turn-helix transcriptional regulator [Paraburkholderia graminis]|jgi:AraC family transcriptional regulator|uniref:AraC family transcriptional regulator n=1 Tax=Paraburkholderia graminis TaxID=60548 RepID=A0ABD5CQE7_9BURK|nr:helix-turn-helix transcriptional regulator [Paraburkholderia graminis]MDR6206760.1 AraC family transcriptional regulator [Paraburkholderia graminis]